MADKEGSGALNMGEENKEDVKKKVDESWKNACEKDRGVASGDKIADRGQMPEATFGLFISGILMEALIALGDVEHPITRKKELSVSHAKFIIETLGMLKDKTRNNLMKDEADSLEAILYDLRMRFVQKAGKSTSPDKSEK